MKHNEFDANKSEFKFSPVVNKEYKEIKSGSLKVTHFFIGVAVLFASVELYRYFIKGW